MRDVAGSQVLIVLHAVIHLYLRFNSVIIERVRTYNNRMQIFNTTGRTSRSRDQTASFRFYLRWQKPFPPPQ